jgi:hypothetical protein
LLEGENPLVSPLDKHSEHIQEHKSVLADPDLRVDPNLVKIVMDHIEQHVNALRNTDPSLLQMIGEQPLPPLQPTNGNPPGGQPNAQGPQQPPQGALQGSPNPGTMAPQGPPAQPGEPVQGPGGQNAPLPSPAKVPAGLLHNPGAQQAAMGNVKG